jgi:hypothetical protein
VIVLSDNYLKAEYTQPEWTAAFVDDPRGDRRSLIPLRVAPCSPMGMLKPLIFADLVGLTQEAAKETVLNAVLDGRLKPPTPPEFPGVLRNAYSVRSAPDFPGATAPAPASRALALWQEKLAFLEGQEPLAVDDNHKFALKKQIEEVREKIRELRE